MEKPNIDYGKCKNDGTCIRVCPMEVFAKEGKKTVVKHPEKCIQCRACEVSCPNSAIEVK
ncbi:MAG: 4Fe-4S binding protein [Candidatus Diapherotrites archaeon]|nr:4Fe-4S binding protein [Candidatus Micrarchaeota archaeon]